MNSFYVLFYIPFILHNQMGTNVMIEYNHYISTNCQRININRFLIFITADSDNIFISCIIRELNEILVFFLKFQQILYALILTAVVDPNLANNNSEQI